MNTYEFWAKRMNETEFTLTHMQADSVKQLYRFAREERFKIKGIVKEI